MPRDLRKYNVQRKLPAVHTTPMSENLFENERNLPQIDLFAYTGAGLILPCKSGVNVRNQVEGFSCSDLGLEGVFVPIEWPLELLKHAFGENVGVSPSGIHADTADIIDAWVSFHNRVLKDYPFRVNRARLEEDREAWVWVSLASNTYASLNFCGFVGDAILTWRNSD
jgi:hypothetical protein